MARQLKFRVFDDIHNSGMCAVLSIDFNNTEFGYVCNCGGVHWIYKKDFSELRQFTGLQDSRGVDIYEGDLLTLEWLTKKSIGEVFFHQGGFYLRDINKKTWFDHLNEFNEVEKIIGNVHKNPELLRNAHE